MKKVESFIIIHSFTQCFKNSVLSAHYILSEPQWEAIKVWVAYQSSHLLEEQIREATFVKKNLE